MEKSKTHWSWITTGDLDEGKTSGAGGRGGAGGAARWTKLSWQTGFSAMKDLMRYSGSLEKG